MEPVNTRVMLGELSRYPAKEQLKVCRALVKERDLPKANSVYQHNEFDEFVNDLQPDEVALVPRLDVLMAYGGRGVGKRFYKNMLTAVRLSCYVLDAETGLQSNIQPKWDAHVDKVYKRITKGRELDPEVAKKMRRKQSVEPGLVQHWRDKEGDDDYIQAASQWGNLGVKPAEAARAKMKDKELQSASMPTLYRIFGTRRECLKWLNENT